MLNTSGTCVFIAYHSATSVLPAAPFFALTRQRTPIASRCAQAWCALCSLAIFRSGSHAALRPLHQHSQGGFLNCQIRVDDLSDPRIAAFLADHLRDMYASSPPESVHALDLGALKRPEIIFYSAWNGDQLLGCGALKRLDARHVELKSMRTSPQLRRTGIGKQILRHLLSEARRMGYHRVSLETGSMQFFEPARALYTCYGFEPCPPFAEYAPDPNSVFMTRSL